MKISTKLLGSLLLAYALCAEAVHGSLILTHNQQQDGFVRTRTIDNLQTDPIATGDNITGGVAGNTDMATGTVSVASRLSDSESFTFTYTGVSDWDASLAQTANSNGTFLTYLGGLTAAEVHSVSDSYGIQNAGTTETAGQLNLLGEALIITADTSNLINGDLVLEAIGFNIYTGGDRTDFVIYDASANSFIEQQFNQNYNGTDSVSGNWRLETGDTIVLAVGADGDGQPWRQQSLTVNVVPEPGSILFLSLALVAGVVFRLRSVTTKSAVQGE
ncbi:MAG: hypothetical protein AAF357_07175 [Verrucomicrobiota bacterium]